MRWLLVAWSLLLASPASADPRHHDLYVRVGAGRSGNQLGASGGLGYRVRRDRVGVDVSALDVTWRGDGATLIDAYLRLTAFAHVAGDRLPGLWLGSGLSYGTTTVTRRLDSGVDYAYLGRGLQLELAVGHELTRTATTRLFVQLGARLPLYRVDTWTGRSYGFGLTLAVGIGI